MNARLTELRRLALERDTPPPVPNPELNDCAAYVEAVRLYLEHCAIDIAPGELIAGGPGAIPEAVAEEIGQIYRRHAHSFRLPEELARPLNAGFMILCGNHAVIDYAGWLAEGIPGLLRKIDRRIAAAGASPELSAWRELAEAYAGYIRRVAAAARSRAASEADPARREELAGIADDCLLLAERPPESFRQACRMLYFGFFFVPDSPGRVDKLLIDFYRAGRVAEEEARDLLGCLWIKYFAQWGKEHLRGGVTHLALGGVDGVNELSWLFLDAAEELALLRPQIALRCYPGMDREFLKRALRLLRRNFGSPDFVNDAAVIPALEALGIAPGDARDYCPSGCHEIMIPGKSHMGSLGGEFNLPRLLNCALGLEPLPSGSGAALPEAGSWEELWDNVLAALDDLAGAIHRASFAVDRDRARSTWWFALGLFTADCIGRGKTYAAGGAVYNFCNWDVIGIPDLADALTAVRTLVFERRLFSLADFRAALAADWRGHEKLLREVESCPRFGNDQNGVDALAASLVAACDRALKRHTPFRGGAYTLGTLAGYENAHAVFGAATAATADGRRAGKAFAASPGAVPGRDRNGVTAMLKSTAALPSRLLPTSVTVNAVFEPELLADEAGLERMAGLIEGYFAAGGIELQPTVVDRETLLAARQQPELYPSLTVRVAGYSARFTSLEPLVQEEIILRSVNA